MNRFSVKKITFFSLSLLLWQFLVLPIKSFAADAIPLKYHPLENGVFDDFTTGVNVTAGDQLGTFLGQAFQFGLAIAAALAVVMIVWGGVEIMLSESVFKKEDGKKKVQDAIWGLVLALVSWLILYTINPDILNFKL